MGTPGGARRARPVLAELVVGSRQADISRLITETAPRGEGLPGCEEAEAGMPDIAKCQGRLPRRVPSKLRAAGCGGRRGKFWVEE